MNWEYIWFLRYNLAFRTFAYLVHNQFIWVLAESSNLSKYHHHHMRSTSVTPNTHGMSGICPRPPVKFLQAQRACSIPFFKPIAFMSLSTQLYVFLGAPLPTITFILMHFNLHPIVLFLLLHMPNHLNPALWILFSTHSMPDWLKSSLVCFLSFKDIPHILHTIILSTLPNLANLFEQQLMSESDEW